MTASAAPSVASSTTTAPTSATGVPTGAGPLGGPASAEIVAQYIPVQVLRTLTDKIYDKRKAAALDVERIVRELLVQRPKEAPSIVVAIIRYLVDDLVMSQVGNYRYGGLIALAGVTIAISSSPELIQDHLPSILDPVLSCFQDTDWRARYYATESLYNVTKGVRSHILHRFPQLFDILCKLSTDSDSSVKNAAELLNRLLKEIITEKKTTYVTNFDLFSLDEFMDLLEERIKTLNPLTRSFLVEWLNVLHSMPGIELLSMIHRYLEGLFKFLGDDNEDLRQKTAALLSELLREISEAVDIQRRLGVGFGALERSLYGEAAGVPAPGLGTYEAEAGHWAPAQAAHLDFARMFAILVPFLGVPELDVRQTALHWLNEFIILARQLMLPFTAVILNSVLPALAAPHREIQTAAETTNSLLMQLVNETNLAALAERTQLDIPAVLRTVLAHCRSDAVDTRMGCLDWLFKLHNKAPHVVVADAALLESVFRCLSDPVEDVVKRGLQLVAQIAATSDADRFDALMADILRLFAKDRRLLETRGALIVRQLCLALSPEDVYRSFSQVLEKEADLDFASTMITNLNLIMITSAEMVDMRKRLRLFEKDGQVLFVDLYRSWSHSPVAAFSLCLLAQAYEHAFNLLQTFEDFEITVTLLVQIDKLVQLLESPVFSYLRLQLLDPERHPYLLKCLYALLMLLPQSSAFATLRNRLSCVSSLGHLNAAPRSSDFFSTKDKFKKLTSEIRWVDLLTHFKYVQGRHERARKAYLSASSMRNQKRSRRGMPTPGSATTSSAPTLPVSAAAMAAATSSASLPAGGATGATSDSSGGGGGGAGPGAAAVQGVRRKRSGRRSTGGNEPWEVGTDAAGSPPPVPKK
ncbi:hypothetical protein GGF32_002442 [Allomyces javanicus]|nr:hypothetical protein GGF32_002442 [Allomyces javanicus]